LKVFGLEKPIVPLGSACFLDSWLPHSIWVSRVPYGSLVDVILGINRSVVMLQFDPPPQGAAKGNLIRKLEVATYWYPLRNLGYPHLKRLDE